MKLIEYGDKVKVQLENEDEDEDEDVRLESAELIGKLVNHGERTLAGFCGTADPDCEVEFREAIASTIPLLINRLKDEDGDVQLAVVEVIGKLENHGE
jgi:hypothetical protein